MTATREIHAARTEFDDMIVALNEQETRKLHLQTRKTVVTTQLDAIMRSAAVKRHHTSNPTQNQSVGEHTYSVMWILFLLLEGNVSTKLMMAALAHDTPEYATGDIPAPAKRTAAMDGLKAFEVQVMQEAALPDFNEFLSDSEIRVLKLADNLEGAAWYANEIIRGNGHAKVPLNNYVAWLQESVVTNEVAFLMLESIKENVREHQPNYKFA
jgi:5'-deoxynucleotidase YfbR-like HD superfamily hydrolase